MKKLLTLALIVVGLTVGPVSGQTAAPVTAFLQTHQLTSLDQYFNWLGENVSYQPDNGSREWADPSTTLARGYGDCKDFALLNQVVLSHFGFSGQIYSVNQFNQDKHAIVVFKLKGRYAMISNDEFYVTEISGMEEFVKYLASEHEFFGPVVIR